VVVRAISSRLCGFARDCMDSRKAAKTQRIWDTPDMATKTYANGQKLNESFRQTKRFVERATQFGLSEHLLKGWPIMAHPDSFR
jgi:hypothetical protein